MKRCLLTTMRRLFFLRFFHKAKFESKLKMCYIA